MESSCDLRGWYRGAVEGEELRLSGCYSDGPLRTSGTRCCRVSGVRLLAGHALMLTRLHVRYLQEVGYTDTILDVKSQRVRALLGLTGDPADKSAERKGEGMVNGTEPSSLKDSGMVRYEVVTVMRRRSLDSSV